MVMSSPFAGAEMITFFAPASMCARALLASVKRPVDSNANCHPVNLLWSPPVAECGRPAEGHKTENACSPVIQRGGARVESGCRGHDVVHEYEMLAAERSASGDCTERARNVAESL